MNKTKFIVFLIILIAIVSLLTVLNYDKISHFLANREWEIADSIGSIELDNYLDAFGTNSEFFLVNAGNIRGYSENAKKTFEKNLSLKDCVSAVAGDYAIVAEKNATNVYMMNKEELAWEHEISNASILAVAINKNGYSAVVYSQAGYKSLIKVFSNAGDELFTSYLASTYAVDVAISNDNKTLAIAELDTNGVSLASAIKLIDIQTASENNVKKYDLESDELVTSVEYDSSNHLVMMTDMGVKILKNDTISEWINFKEENFTQCVINNSKKLIAVKVEEEGLFNVKCYICIYDWDNRDDVKLYEIEETPNQIVTCNDMIAVDTGSKIIFLNTNGNFVKKCEYNGQLKDIQLFHQGKTAVLMFRDSAEFIKVGGM